jgi:hypothetical protein
MALFELLAQETREHIDATARREWYDDANGSARIGAVFCEGGDDIETSSRSRQRGYNELTPMQHRDTFHSCLGQMLRRLVALRLEHLLQVEQPLPILDDGNDARAVELGPGFRRRAHGRDRGLDQLAEPRRIA